MIGPVGTGTNKQPGRKTNPFKAKNAKGSSFKTIASKKGGNGGGAKEVAKVAKSAGKGMAPGVGVSRTTVEPYRGKNSQGGSYKTAIDEWCQGKSKSYRA
jgi:hypothetical protein